MDESTKAFPEALEAVLADQEVSRRELVRRCKRLPAKAGHPNSTRGWGNVATLHYLASGEEPPSMRAMENISTALNISPTYFAEYRLGLARAALDERVVGVDKALAALDRVAKPLGV